MIDGLRHDWVDWWRDELIDEWMDGLTANELITRWFEWMDWWMYGRTEVGWSENGMEEGEQWVNRWTDGLVGELRKRMNWWMGTGGLCTTSILWRSSVAVLCKWQNMYGCTINYVVLSAVYIIVWSWVFLDHFDPLSSYQLLLSFSCLFLRLF